MYSTTSKNIGKYVFLSITNTGKYVLKSSNGVDKCAGVKFDFPPLLVMLEH